MTAAILMMAAEEGDRTAHRLAEENRAIRAIFDHAVSRRCPPVGRAPAQPGEGDESDLRISALQAVNDALRDP